MRHTVAVHPVKLYTGPHYNARDKAWQFKYRDADGTRRTKLVPSSAALDEEGATRWADTFMSTYAQTGKPPVHVVVPPLAKHTLTTLHAKWWPLREADPKIRPGTLAGNRGIFKLHVLPHPVASLPLEAAFKAGPDGELPIIRYFRALATKLAPMTVWNVHTALSCMLTDAIDKGWLTPRTNPFQGKSVRNAMPVAETLAGDAIVFPPQVLRGLLECEDVPPLRRALYRVAAFTGLRAGELYGLRWSDVRSDHEVPHLAIERQCAQYGSGGYGTLDATKTKNGRRLVPMHEHVIDVLEAWRQAWNAYVGHEPAEHDPIFPGIDGEHVRPHIASLLRGDLGRAHLATHADGQPLTFHAFRRSFVGMLEEAGVHGEVIDNLLGHTRKTTRGKSYSPLVQLRPGADAMARLVVPLDLIGGLTPTPAKRGRPFSAAFAGSAQERST